MTFVSVTLGGKDIAKWIPITYAMEKMAIPALQAYIQTEIANRIGDVEAKDIFDTISADLKVAEGAYTANENIKTAAAASFGYDDIAGAFGLLKRVNGVSVYANRKTIYTYVIGLTANDGHPVFQTVPTDNGVGTILGAPVKIEDGLDDGVIYFGDPQKYVENVLQPIMIESEKDVKTHENIYSGYMREEGTLTDKKAFVQFTVTTA